MKRLLLCQLSHFTVVLFCTWKWNNMNKDFKKIRPPMFIFHLHYHWIVPCTIMDSSNKLANKYSERRTSAFIDLWKEGHKFRGYIYLKLFLFTLTTSSWTKTTPLTGTTRRSVQERRTHVFGCMVILQVCRVITKMDPSLDFFNWYLSQILHHVF